jgi:hypothetical protein
MKHEVSGSERSLASLMAELLTYAVRTVCITHSGQSHQDLQRAGILLKLAMSKRIDAPASPEKSSNTIANRTECAFSQEN